MDEKFSISVILPAYNEEGNIQQVIGNSVDFLQEQNAFGKYEIIVIDDGSNDKTANVLIELMHKIPYLRVVTHHKNLGYGEALISGLKISQYPLVLFMDADGQFDIREINKFLLYLYDFGIIAGYRHKRKDGFYRVFLGKIYSWLVTILFGLKLEDINCGFKLFRKTIFEDEATQCRNGVFYTEVLLRAKEKGYKIKQVAVEHFPRLKGKATGARPRVIFNSIVDLIKLRYSLRRIKIGTFNNAGGKNESRKIGINGL